MTNTYDFILANAKLKKLTLDASACEPFVQSDHDCTIAEFGIKEPRQWKKERLREVVNVQEPDIRAMKQKSQLSDGPNYKMKSPNKASMKFYQVRI